MGAVSDPVKWCNTHLLTCLTVYTLLCLDGRVRRLQTVKNQQGSVFIPTGHGAKTELRHNCECMTVCLRLFTEAWVCRGSVKAEEEEEVAPPLPPLSPTELTGLEEFNHATCVSCCTVLHDELGRARLHCVTGSRVRGSRPPFKARDLQQHLLETRDII